VSNIIATDLAVSEAEAKQEAVELAAYWFKQGYWGVRTWTKLTVDGYVVNSNVGIGGFPPK
jgi:hypothetical protein